MEKATPSHSSVHALQNAYLRVVAQRKANASMLRWSLAYADAEKQRRSGEGVTLYLL